MDADLAVVAKDRCTWCGSKEFDLFPGKKGEWFRCGGCGFWRHSLIVNVQDYAQEDYNLDYQNSYYGRAIERKRRTGHFRFRVFEKVHPQKGTFLDIGSSFGSMLVAGAERGWKTCGIDISPSVVELTRSQGLDTHCAQMVDMPFEDASIDFINARHVLEHDIHTYRILREFWRVLKPGGTICIEVPDGDCRRMKRSAAHEAARWSYLHMVTFTPRVLAGFCTRAGYQFIPEPKALRGPLPYLVYRAWRLFRERNRLATYFVTYWRKPVE